METGILGMINQSTKRQIFIRAARGSGKTEALMQYLKDTCLDNEGTHCLFLASLNNQARLALGRAVITLAGHVAMVQGQRSASVPGKIYLNNGSIISFASLSQLASMRGYSCEYILIDDAGDLPITAEAADTLALYHMDARKVILCTSQVRSGSLADRIVTGLYESDNLDIYTYSYLDHFRDRGSSIISGIMDAKDHYDSFMFRENYGPWYGEYIQVNTSLISDTPSPTNIDLEKLLPSLDTYY